MKLLVTEKEIYRQKVESGFQGLEHEGERERLVKGTNFQLKDEYVLRVQCNMANIGESIVHVNEI